MRQQLKTRFSYPKMSAEDRFRMQTAMDGGVLAFSVIDQEDAAVINIQGAIGDEWDGVTAMDLVPAVQAIAKPIKMRISTPGGYVNQAIDAFDVLVNHPHEVTADIFEASSAGTILAAAADKTRIAPAGTYMIHQPWTGFLIMGNADEIEEQISSYVQQNLATLRLLGEEMVSMVADRTNASADEVRDWMIGEDGQDGTEFVGMQAVDAGLVDEIIPTPKKTSAERVDYKNRALRHAAHMIAIKRGHYANEPQPNLTKTTEPAK